MITVASLKQSVIPWSYKYKPPDSNIQYDVQNTCSIDTSLHMIFFLWIRGFVPHSVVEKVSILLETLNNVRKGEYNKAQHDFLLRKALPKKVEKVGNKVYWNCWSPFWDNKPVPELFNTPCIMQMIWGNCSKMGENCPFHDFFQKKSTDLVFLKMLNLMKGPKETVQE